jgi:hypothetical protein
VAVRYVDSFDLYSTADIPLRWDVLDGGPHIETVHQRTGRACIELASVLKKIDAQGVWIAGAAHFVRASTKFLFEFWDTTAIAGPTRQCSLGIRPDGVLASFGGAFSVQQAAAPLSTAIKFGRYFYIECKVAIAHGGSMTVRVNGEQIAVLAGDYQVSEHAFADQLGMGGPGGGASNFADDLYFADANGGFNDDFIGPVIIDALMPAADTGTIQWTPSAAVPHFSLVSEQPEDGDATYVFSPTVNQQDLYTLTATPAPASVKAVQSSLWARKDDALARQIKLLLLGVDTFSTAITLSNAYADYLQVFQKNPVTALPWVPADLNGGTFGVKLFA